MGKAAHRWVVGAEGSPAWLQDELPGSSPSPQPPVGSVRLHIPSAVVLLCHVSVARNGLKCQLTQQLYSITSMKWKLQH